MVNLAQELSHIYWIGGSPCAGKTTIARKLAAEYGFTYYKCDDCYDDHISRSTPDQHPNMYKIKDQTWDQVWSTQFCSLSVEEQIEDVIRVYEEQFSLILEDLLARPKTTPIVVEGATLLPHKVAPLLTDLSHAIWMVPTTEFQVEHYKKREWIHRILDQYDDPGLAFSNWMKRDSGFAKKIVKDTEDMNMKSVSVDGSFSIDQSYNLVKMHFELN